MPERTDFCPGRPSPGWLRASRQTVCTRCGQFMWVRPNPFGPGLACWPCWARITFSGEKAATPHAWRGGGCLCCGAWKIPVVRENCSDGPDEPLEPIDATPCPLCGQPGACGYDEQGRALIHAISADGED